MSNAELLAILTWRMCSDPWPSDQEDIATIDAWLNLISMELGYVDWVDAYHELPEYHNDE